MIKSLPLLLLLVPVLAFAQDSEWDDEEWGEDEPGTVWSGFVEGGFGARIERDRRVGDRNTLMELRWRLESEWQSGRFTIGFKADAGYDAVEQELNADVRDLSVAFRLGQSTDVKLGRQVLTWGTGDLVFLNDLFPKDFVSFFAGRDDEYLKAPGDAIRLTHFSERVNVDLAWTPVFDPDVYLDGERFSFFSPLAGTNVAPNPPLSALEPAESLSTGELALRLFRTVNSREYALYAYRGFFKQPTALTATLRPTFAPLSALGASVRAPLGPGLVNVETAVYLSRDDRSGTDPRIPNDQLRLLAGYEWEAKTNFTVGLQYYLEWTQDHDALLANSPTPGFEPEERRHVLTNRLTWRFGRDRHTWSLFTFYSPSDDDFYVRPGYSFRHSDQWSLSAGASLFGGDEPHTFFKQLEDASNVYVRLRYHY